jgi:radical SAM/Cys-rich protein
VTVLTSLHARAAPLADPATQLERLDAVSLPEEFEGALARSGWRPLRPGPVEILQINVGKLCNMTCRHCHVDAGPDRVVENMSRETLEACVAALDRLPSVHTVDITGGAPELNPGFEWLVDECIRRGKHVIDRCNLTILLVARNEHLAGWLAERGVELVCSLPHWRRPNTDAQRGDGTFDRSIRALRMLNAVGYGKGDPKRVLTLMHNPAGAFLPGAQAALEREWRDGLERTQGVTFDRLIALNNMPIARYLEWLEATGNLDSYLQMLQSRFNGSAIAGLMCRNTLSIGWDGAVHDCDFNQMLAMEANIEVPHVTAVTPELLARRAIRTGRHCFGCTAGAGSSCGGATA